MATSCTNISSPDANYGWSMGGLLSNKYIAVDISVNYTAGNVTISSQVTASDYEAIMNFLAR